MYLTITEDKKMKKKTLNKVVDPRSCRGACVKCGSFNISYGRLDSEGDLVFYPYSCPDCNHKGKEVYYAEYQEST
jgi:hypothetical protein